MRHLATWVHRRNFAAHWATFVGTPPPAPQHQDENNDDEDHEDHEDHGDYDNHEDHDDYEAHERIRMTSLGDNQLSWPLKTSHANRTGRK